MHEHVIEVEVQFKRKGTRRVIIAPMSMDDNSNNYRQPDPNLVKAILRGHRWHKLILEGRCANIEALAAQEKVTSSFAARIVRLASLAPQIKISILDGTQPKTLKVIDVLKDFPWEWDKQLIKFGYCQQ